MAPRILPATALSLALPNDVRDLLLEFYAPDSLHQILRALTLPPNETTVRVDDLLRPNAGVDVKSLLAAVQAAARCQRPVKRLPDLPEAIVIPHCERSFGGQPAGLRGGSAAGQHDGPRVVAVVVGVVVVDRMCGEAVLRGSHVFAPGVIGCSAGVVSGVEVDVLVDCKGGYQRASSPDAYEGELVRVGRGVAEMARKEMDTDGRKGVAVRMLETEFGPTLPSFAGIQAALAPIVNVVSSQSLPSMVVARVLVEDYLGGGSYPPPRVLDMCAAPGGKTTHVAALLGGRCEIFACERSRQRALKLLQRCTSYLKTAGLPPCISCVQMDSVKAVDSPTSSQQSSTEDAADRNASMKSKRRARWKALRRAEHLAKAYLKKLNVEPVKQTGILAKVLELVGAEPQLDVNVAVHRAMSDESSEVTKLKIISKFEEQSFDCVLLDGPCSALGLRPRLALDARISAKRLRSFAHYQQRLIDAAVKLVMPGGVLVYSTCTINPLENEGNVAYTLSHYKEFDLEMQQPNLGKPGLHAFDLTTEQCSTLQRFEPSQSGGSTNGFFCAKFRKRKV